MNDTNTTYDTAVRDADFDDFADSAIAIYEAWRQLNFAGGK